MKVRQRLNYEEKCQLVLDTMYRLGTMGIAHISTYSLAKLCGYVASSHWNEFIDRMVDDEKILIEYYPIASGITDSKSVIVIEPDIDGWGN